MTKRIIIHDLLVLKQKSTPAAIRDLDIAIDLKDTLIANRKSAAGLAANMIGETKQIIAFYAGPLVIVMLNPVIVEKSDQYLADEGCLSLPGTRKVKRYKNITVNFQDMNMKKQTQKFVGYVAEVIQHEVDHCRGIMV
ncbi:peptide deformylase [Lactobacillus sp. ESL0791]|uniref:peptide deformylase n=1 Tax=Lactobacillus sp. ESL0791 TaxID=2983234 RepID=UPI0023F78929|nr:peptide deformylase [Lactobacillus sp. ESL0791]MDF7637887.1 peptide deformylase [Lactobacillus sp. ESL0791]